MILPFLMISLGNDGVGADQPKTGEPKVGDLRFEPYTYETKDGQKVDGELGHLVVPENRKNPTGKTIELAFARIKSTAKNPGPPIIHLAGGPGNSGINSLRGKQFSFFMALREMGDLIMLDQRGIGLSKPYLKPVEKMAYPLNKACDGKEILEMYKEKCRACAEYWKGEGVDLSAYNTNESADDIESLRQALGAEKVILTAHSYGTHLALATIRRHGKSIHSAILAGVEGPDQTFKLPSNVQKHLVHISQLAQADPETKQMVPDFLELVQKVLDQLEKQPITIEVKDPKAKDPIKVTVGKSDLQWYIGGSMGNIQVIATYPNLFYSLSKGDTSSPPVQKFAQAMIGLRTGTLASAMELTMDASSNASKERLARIEREGKEALLGNFVDFPFPGLCEAWPGFDLGSDFHTPIQSKVPVLFISGALDGRTPPSNVEEIQGGFPNSTHVIIDGASHVWLFTASPQTKDVVLDFLKGKRISNTQLAAPPLKFAWGQKDQKKGGSEE